LRKLYKDTVGGRVLDSIKEQLHFAAHGNTAAESGAVIAKKHLSDDELDTLNRIVMIYLEFAELQAITP
jgi:hypothetical protein